MKRTEYEVAFHAWADQRKLGRGGRKAAFDAWHAGIIWSFGKKTQLAALGASVTAILLDDRGDASISKRKLLGHLSSAEQRIVNAYDAIEAAAKEASS